MASDTASLESDPLNVEAWEQLRVQAAASGDFLGVKTLPVVIAGIRRLNERLEGDGGEGSLFSRLSGMQRAALVKLAGSYNNPRVLKDIGMLYLGDFRLPEVAGEHFRRARELNEGDETLEGLIERAEAAVTARKNRKGPGVDEQEHARKQVAGIIRKTGKVAMTTQQLKGIAPPPAQADAVDPRSATGRLAADTGTIGLPDANEKALDAAVRQVMGNQIEGGMDAAAQLATQVESDDERFVVWTEVAYACFLGGHYEAALEAYAKARDAAPDILMSWFNYGLALQVTGAFDEALEAYRKGDGIEPNHPKVWCNIGALYFQTDRFAASEQALRKTVEIRPSYARAWDNLAAALGAQDKLAEARHACQRALALRPEFPEAWFKLAMVCFYDNEVGEAEKGFNHALSHEGLAPYALNYLALIAVGRGDLDTAEKLARQGLDLEPANPAGVTAWLEIGIEACKKEQFDRAVAALSQATAIDDESFEAWFNLGRTYEIRQDMAESRDAYAKAVACRPESYAACHRLGRVALAMRDLPLAIQAYTQLAEIAPDDEIPWRRLAAALEAKGMKKEANEAMLTAESLAGKPDRSVAHITSALERIRGLVKK